MWEAEIRRIMVPGQLRQKNNNKKVIRPHLNRKKLGVVVHNSHPSYGRSTK
jgi:hypothetical protein